MNNDTRVHFVYRKPNPGNYSIENVFDQLIKHWESAQRTTVSPKKIQLKYNYDLFSFLGCFFKSLFGVYQRVHITGGCNYMGLAFPFARRVLTIHDLFYLSRGKVKFRKLYSALYYSWPIRFAHTVTVVSEQTKKELMEYFPWAEKKVVVVANPLNLSLLDSAKDVKLAARPQPPLRILQLGSKPLKNYRNLLLGAKGLDVRFTFVHGDTDAIKRLIDQHQLNDKAEVMSNLSFSALIDQYRAVDVLFFASFAEGFGLPLIEAQAVHLPIITSNLEPMQSLAPHAVLVDPYQPTEIHKAIEQIIKNGVTEESLKLGAAFARQFTPSKIAAAYEAVYLTTG